MKIKSPVTESYNTSVLREIPVFKLVELYNEELRLDVSEYFHGLPSIQLVQCNDTGYRFYYPFDIFGDDKFYQFLQNFENYYSHDKWEYRAARKLIGDDESVLEIGSGGAQFLQSLKNSARKELCGLELNTAAVKSARDKGLDVVDEVIETYSKKNPGRFDVVVSLQVLEHICDVRSYILGALQTLKKGGKLIICVPNNNPFIYKQDFYHTLNLPPHHAGLWNRDSFGKLPGFFPMKLKNVFIEPLQDYKVWYKTQVRHLKEQGSALGGLLAVIPRPLYKAPLILFRNVIEGRNIMVEFIKS